MFQCWYIKLFTVQTSENVCIHVFKYSARFSLVSDSQTSENVWDLAEAAPPTETDFFSSIYSSVFYLSVSVGSPAAESLSTISHLGRMENDVNLFFLSNPFCFRLIYSVYLSLFEGLHVHYKKIDFGVKISGRMFSDVVQIQASKSLYSRFTALQSAHVNIANFWPKVNRCLLVSECVFSLLSFSQNLAPGESVLSCLFCTIGIVVK